MFNKNNNDFDLTVIGKYLVNKQILDRLKKFGKGMPLNTFKKKFSRSVQRHNRSTGLKEYVFYFDKGECKSILAALKEIHATVGEEIDKLEKSLNKAL